MYCLQPRLIQAAVAALCLTACSGGGGSNALSAAPSGSISAPQLPSVGAPPVSVPSVSVPPSSSPNINSQTWPATFRPFAANAPWNIALPESPSRLLANSAAMVATLFSGGDTAFTQAWIQNTKANGGFPIFLSTSGDPLVTFSCVPGSPQGHIPANARAAAGSDHHLGIIQSNGDEFDGWLVSDPGRDWKTGDSVNCQIGAKDNVISGMGIESPSTTSGNSLAAGLIRSDELGAALASVDGILPHAIVADVSCVQGTPVYPGTSNATLCKGGSSVPIGARLQLDLTFPQIDALAADNYTKVILRTLHRYGAIVDDTDDWFGDEMPHGGMRTKWEDPTPFTANGQPVPLLALGQSLGWTYDASTQTINGPDPGSAVDFSTHLRVVDPCYSQGTCSS